MDQEKLLNHLSERTRNEADNDLGDIEQFLTFTINGEYFGLQLLHVHEILKPVMITRIPNVEDYILGVINLRGEIIPIVDLKKRFHEIDSDITPISRIVVVMLNEKRCGILVDEVKQVVKVQKDFISYTVDDLSLNYSKMVESVSRHENHLILNLDFTQIVDFISFNK
ncbi:purine-binding chemotaxis protein CheW [Leptospira ognonensis]|uniref:Purine-binding chemotaxis protein CheW n=1 Tax=Leptospira ognonensis TaxID=2484945 RepID=A0A4R9K1A8_9LEPT|nr:chemotaxis protein CheW [Leptospira ognonensis]TGL57966.1 purine-binding chemotaxis protein CheW [Leptospira ognonensis]